MNLSQEQAQEQLVREAPGCSYSNKRLSRQSSGSSHFDELRQLMSANPSSGRGENQPAPSGEAQSPQLDNNKRQAVAQLARTWSSKLKLRGGSDAFLSPQASSKLSGQLEKQALRGVEFLNKLQQLVLSRKKLTVAPVMPPTALYFSKGLVFLWQHKVGLIGSYGWASGFIIERVGGHRQWSAPCFFKVRCLSAGLTAGFFSKEICFALPTDDGVNILAQDFRKMNLDVNISLFIQDPTNIEVPKALIKTPRHLATKLDLRSQPKVYQLGDGLMADISWSCCKHTIDIPLNETLYGRGITPASILEGHVKPPAEFKPFYKALQMVTACAPVIRKNEPLFYVAKELRNTNSSSRKGSASSAATTFTATKTTRVSMDGSTDIDGSSSLNTMGSNTSSNWGAMFAGQSSPGEGRCNSPTSPIGSCSTSLFTGKLFHDVPEFELAV